MLILPQTSSKNILNDNKLLKKNILIYFYGKNIHKATILSGKRLHDEKALFIFL